MCLLRHVHFHFMVIITDIKSMKQTSTSTTSTTSVPKEVQRRVSNWFI